MKMEEQSHVWMNRCNEQKMQIEELKRKLEAKERQCTDFAQVVPQLSINPNPTVRTLAWPPLCPGG